MDKIKYRVESFTKSYSNGKPPGVIKYNSTQLSIQNSDLSSFQSMLINS